MGRAGGQREKGNQPVSQGQDRQTQKQKSRMGQYIEEVNEPRGSKKIKRNKLSTKKK